MTLSRRRIGVLLLLVFIASAVAFWLAGRERGSLPLRGKPVSYWLMQTAAGDHRLRNEAEGMLDDLGSQAVPDLIRALRARDSRTLDRLKSLLTSVFPRVDWGHGTSRILHRQAAIALARLGPQAVEATGPLTELLFTEDPDLLREVELALRKTGSAGVPALIRALQDPLPVVRSRAAGLLGNGASLAADAEPILDALFVATKDTDEEVRFRSVTSVGEYTNDWARVVPQLGRTLEDRSYKVRANSARSLARFRAQAWDALPRLRERVGDESGEVRLCAAVAVWSIARDAELAVPALVRLLEDPDLRWQAALALGDMGEAAEKAIPALLQSLKGEQAHRPSRTPASSALALSRMGAKAVPGLIDLLSHPELRVRVGAAIALAEHGTNAVGATPLLRGMLREHDAEAQIVACRVLERIGPAACAAAAELRVLRQDREEYVRAAAQRALTQVEEAAGPGEPEK